jgi:hypothetical protein
MFARLYPLFGLGVAPAAVRLPETHETQLQFNDGSVFLLTRLSPVLVRTYYEKAAARNAAPTDAGAIEMQKDFTNAARPITAAAMQLVMDLLSAPLTSSQGAAPGMPPPPPPKDATTPIPTTTLAVFAPSDPPFVPLQSRALYAAISTPRLIDAAYLASELELEAPFEGLAAEVGRRVHALLTLGGISKRRNTNAGSAPTITHPYDGKSLISWSVGESLITQTIFGPPGAAAITHALGANESILHAVARPDVTVWATTTTRSVQDARGATVSQPPTTALIAAIVSSLCVEVGASDWTKGGAAASERFADLAVLINMRDPESPPSEGPNEDEPLLRRLLRRRWQPDAEASHCKQCHSRFFGVTTLRSHCRRCGDIYCKKCLAVHSTDAVFATLEKPGGGDSADGPRKICRACHEIVGEGTVARFYIRLIEGMGLSLMDVRALMLLGAAWEVAAVELLWQFRKETYLMRQCVAHDAMVLSSMGVAVGHPELVLRILGVKALWSLPPAHPIVNEMLATVASSFKSSSALVAGCGLLYCTRTCKRTRADMGTFAIRVLRAIAHHDSAPHAAEVRAMALSALYKVMNDTTQRDVARLSTDAWLHALLDMYFSAHTCQRARGDDIVAVSEGALMADRSRLETRLYTLLDAIVYIAVRSDAMRMKVACESVYRHSSRDTAVRGWCATLDASLMIARSNFEIVHRVREKAAAPSSCFSDVQGIGTFQTVLMTLQQCAMTAIFDTVEEARACLYGLFPATYRGQTANDTIWFPRSAPYFFNPKKFMHGIVLREVKLYNSNTRPVGLVFLVSREPVLADRDEKENLCTRARVILKRDRLRQDQVCCEVAALLPRLMQGDAPRHRVLSYHVLPLTEDCGIVELLENAPNLQTVTKDEGKTLAELLKSQITGPDDARRTFFLDSVRFLVIIGSVLGLGDRHRSNIVLDKDQLQLCHIDFGRVLGDRTMFEKADRVWNYLCGGGWDPKDIVVRFDDELAAAVDAMGEPPEVFIEKVARLIVDHVRPNVELLYLVMSRLREVLEDSHTAQQPQQLQRHQDGGGTTYPIDSPYIGLLSHQRASAPLYDRAGQLIPVAGGGVGCGIVITQARLLRGRDDARTADAVYQYLHQCLRTSQNDRAVVLELCALLLPRDRVIQDKLHHFNQVAMSEGGWVSYGLGRVYDVSSAAAASASGAASSWFGKGQLANAAASPPSSG